MPEDEYYNDTLDEGSSFAPSRKSVDVDKMRESGTFKRLKKRFRDNCSRQRNPGGGIGAPCGICGEPIDYSYSHPHPLSFSVDHVQTARDAPHLFMDVNNFQASHLKCNLGRGSDELPIDIGSPSELW